MSALSHILAAEPEDSAAPAPPPPPSPPAPRTTPPPPPSSADTKAAQMPPKKYMPSEENADTPKDDTGAQEDNENEPQYTSTTTSTRRNASGSVSSVYSGNKIRHLKKEDGIPLWRKDIQYDFLRLVFYDQTKCFTKKSDGTNGWTFAEIYIDAMAKSSKCSKILKEKLLQDVEGALSMAMVCLLVNVGRMNTTLNFFPEMRAQLRTYHSIPALQAHQDPNAYKQLQDAPRLKSILKGATEDEPQPSTIEEVVAAQIPRTNPVNLIFVMSQYAPKISETHFQTRDFFDLVMRGSLSSASRARAFLWLIWWYLESDFSYADSQKNPFGKGTYGEGDQEAGALPVRIPPLESLTEEQAALENVDTEDEITFGEIKRKERIAILASEPSPAMTALKRARKEKGLHIGSGGAQIPSDDEASEAGWQVRGPGPSSAAASRSAAMHHETASDYTRSPSPSGRGFSAVNSKPGMGIGSLLNNDEMPAASPPQAVPTPSTSQPVKKGPGRGNWRRKKPAQEASTPSASRQQDDRAQPVPLLPNTGQPISFVADGPLNMAPDTPANYQNSLYNGTVPYGSQQQSNNNGSHVPTPSYQAQKRSRGQTQHQSALVSHRKQRIEYALDRRIQQIHAQAREQREREGPVIRAWKRIRLAPGGYDSEEERIRMRKSRDRGVPVGGGMEENGISARGKENFDTERETDALASIGIGGNGRRSVLIAGFAPVQGEMFDAGEEARNVAKSFARCERRLERWEMAQPPGLAMQRMREARANGTYWEKMPRGTFAEGRERGKRRSRREREGSGWEADRMDVDGEEMQDEGEDEDGGERSSAGRRRDGTTGAELDEQDREMLEEVDADESEEGDDEDEDEDDGEN